jgi:hypothetical protein
MTRSVNKRLGLWLILFFAALLGCIPLLDYIDQHEQEYGWIAWVFGIGILLFLFGNLALMALYSIRQQKRYGHRCPRCNNALIGFSVPLAIATGNCGRCGEPVLTDPVA